MDITILIPVLNERETLEPLVEQIIDHIGPHEYRILFVDDGSADGSHEVLRALHERLPTVDVIRFRRNFGKSAALAAGFAKAHGDLVITMDGDLQDDPKEIPNFIRKIEEGYDVVCGWKQRRRDPWHKTFPSRIYNAVVSRLFRLELHDINCGYKAFRIEAAKHLPIYGEMHRLIPALAANLGYRVAEIPVEHHPRRYGKSKYGAERYFRSAVDVLTVMFLSRYRFAPGHCFGRIGFLAVALAVLCGAVAVLGWTVWDAPPVAAIVLTILSTGFLMGGLLMIGLGLLGELVVRHHHDPDPSPHIAQEHIH